MQKKVSYHAYLIESLKNSQEATAYLKAVLEEGNVEMIQKAINNLIEAGYNNFAISLKLQDLNNPVFLSAIAVKAEYQNLLQAADIKLSVKSI